MKTFLSNRWIIIGITLIALGWSPLFVIIALAAVGLWPDPDPNPVGPGILFFFTFWPAVICLGTGAVQSWRRKAHG